MDAQRRFALTTLAALCVVVPAAQAQVVSIQVAPASVQLQVGGTTELLASAYDARGNLMQDVEYRWTSNDRSVATVTVDPVLPSLVTVTGVSEGVTTIEVRVGNVTKAVGVGVTGAAQPQPQQQPPAAVPERAPELPDTVMAAGVSDRAGALTARVRAFPFQTAPTCASAFLVGGTGLFVTTYHAIRGADRLELEFGGRTMTDVQVAAYDLQSDVAVLRVAGVIQNDSLPLASRLVNRQVLWAFGHPGCGALDVRRTTVAGQRSGTVQLGDALAEGQRGAPLVTQQGEAMAIALGDATAVGAPQAERTITEARSNLRLLALLTPEEVGRRLNHLYGSLTITSGLAGTVARVSPLEDWQWPETAAEGPTPFTFTGPMGRYRVQLVQNGAVRSTTEVTVRPGEVTPLSLAAPVAQGPTPSQPPAQVQAPKGGHFPIALVLLGVAGAGAGAYFAFGSKGGTATNNNTTTTGPGSIVITVPNP